MPAIRDVVERVVPDLTDEKKNELTQALINREEANADLMRLAANQLGMYPALVTKVLTDLGIGLPVDEERRAYINQQFDAAIAEINRRASGGQA